MFLSSYIPLYVLLISKSILERLLTEEPNTALYYSEAISYIGISIFGILLLVSIIFLWIFSRRIGDLHYYKIVRAEDETDSMFFNYISLYLLPCLGLSLNSVTDTFVVLFIMALIGCIYIPNRLTYIHPALQLQGYKMYRGEIQSVSTKETVSTIILAKKKIRIIADGEKEYRGSAKGDFVVITEDCNASKGHR